MFTLFDVCLFLLGAGYAARSGDRVLSLISIPIIFMQTFLNYEDTTITFAMLLLHFICCIVHVPRGCDLMKLIIECCFFYMVYSMMYLADVHGERMHEIMVIVLIGILIHTMILVIENRSTSSSSRAKQDTLLLMLIGCGLLAVLSATSHYRPIVELGTPEEIFDDGWNNTSLVTILCLIITTFGSLCCNPSEYSNLNTSIMWEWGLFTIVGMLFSHTHYPNYRQLALGASHYVPTYYVYTRYCYALAVLEEAD